MPLRTWIEIDTDALTENYRTACALTQAKVTCVLKSNAYGHGAVAVARLLREAGCRSFAVSCVREALELRAAGIRDEILVMTPADPDEVREAAANDLLLTAACAEDLTAADAAASALGRMAHLMIKLDTGFHRLGFPCTPEAADSLAALLPALTHVSADGLYSHLGLVTQERDERQYALFIRMRDLLAERGIRPADLSLCDSIGLVRYPDRHLSRCRVGAFLYGVRPSRSEHLPFRCAETLTFRSRVLQVRDVDAGETVGYDETPLEKPLRIATVGAGYGDGYPRRLSNGIGKVLIRGRRAPVVGLVCMDQMMVDVSGIPDCTPGDTVTLLGGGISFGEFADWAGSNRNECLAALSRRPVRVYLRGGRPIRIQDDLIPRMEDTVQ